MSHLMTALAMQVKGLKPATKIVLYWLADHHNSETGDCFPSLKTLCEECEMSRPTLVSHLDKLENAGLISREHRTRDNGSQTSTRYVLALDHTPVKNLNSPCKDSLPPPVKNFNPHNLGKNNLGSEQEEKDLFQGVSQQSTDQPEATVDQLFDKFWKAYPKKAGKPAARKAFGKAIERAPAQTIIEKARRYAEWLKEGDEKTFRPHPKYPQGWLNEDRWDDPDLVQTPRQQLNRYQKIVADARRGA